MKQQKLIGFSNQFVLVKARNKKNTAFALLFCSIIINDIT